jgi:hypothetical protein
MTNQHTPLTLFIIKQFYAYGSPAQMSNGLWSSANFVVNMLLQEGHRAKLVEAIDGNSVDALVAQNNPARVVIEALWVTPRKMAELQRLYPNVRWTVRVHSEIPFLANEGSAVSWIAAYFNQGVEVAFNSAQTVCDFEILGHATYLPNYYPLRKPRALKPASAQLDVGCFGAIRPLKNQLIQAFAAIEYARSILKPLVFHINGARIEQLGQNNLKNIEALFMAAGQTLEIHPWMNHEAFLDLIAEMDICLQVSLSESFNIVSADAVSMGVPLVGSNAISWLPKRSQAAVNSASSIADAMRMADSTAVAMNHAALEGYLQRAEKEWIAWIRVSRYYLAGTMRGGFWDASRPAAHSIDGIGYDTKT